MVQAVQGLLSRPNKYESEGQEGMRLNASEVLMVQCLKGLSPCSPAGSWAIPGVELKAIASYKGPLLPSDEDQRMRTVCCAVQNREDDPVLSSICKLVCSLLRVPASGLSLCFDNLSLSKRMRLTQRQEET